MDKRIDELAAQLASRVWGPNALQKYTIWGLQVGVTGLEQELENLEVRQNQLFEELVKIYNKRGNRAQAEQDASALIQEYQQLHPESRGGIVADFKDAGEFQLEVFGTQESKAPNPTALKSQPDLSRLVRPVVQDAVVYVKPGYKRAVVLAADNTTQEAVLQIRGSVEPAQLNFDRLCSAMPVGNYKFPGIYTQKTDLSLAQKATARAAMARNANKFSVDKYESLWPEPPKPKNPKIWDTYDSDLCQLVQMSQT
jgi:hypothetical protein